MSLEKVSTDLKESLKNKLIDLTENQEDLGENFQKVLFENLMELYGEEDKK